MRKALALAVLTGVALTLPAAADAAVFRGVLVAKDPTRQAIVIASPNGRARTVYVGHALGKLAVGRRLVVTARPLASGAYVGRSIRVLGRARHARLRAVIVRAQGPQGRYLVSAGGSTFTLRAGSARARRTASGRPAPLNPGMAVMAEVTPRAGGPAASTISPLGQTATIPLKGIFLGVTDNMLDLAVVGSGLVRLTVPPGFVMPAFTPGQLVSATVSPGPNGELLLTGIEEDDQAPAPGGIHITITIVNNNTNTNNNNNHNNNNGGDGDDDDSDSSSSSSS